jgi:hypothetical protein
MRAPLIALLCGLAAAAAVLALRDGGEHREARLAIPVPTRSSAAVPAQASGAVSSVSPRPQALVSPARLPGTTSAASIATAAVSKPPLSDARSRRAVFALSSDHQALVQDTLLASADHDLLEREPRDDAWATESERLIRQELARHGSAADFDVIAVDCRQTLCAIEAFSYGENGHREWLEAMDEAFKDALGTVFTSINTAFPTEGSRAPVLTFLHRRPVAPNP